MEKAEKVDKIYDKFKNKFVGDLHNVLWQIIVNGVREDKISAFTSAISANGYKLGIADEQIKGYSSTGVVFKEPALYDDVQKVIENLNKAVFRLDALQGAKIALSTM